jgi:uncharacterized repeat protein (TIGR04052 family)
MSIPRVAVRRFVAVAAAAVAAFAATTSYVLATPVARKISIHFSPMVGAEPFACGKTFANIGRTGVSLTPSDFAFYVSEVRLLTRDGREVPVTLDQDLYQTNDLALLDFEDGTGPCLNGNASVHADVTGTVPDGDYTGVAFTIGVPFDRNHLDLATQPSPLSVTRMFWAWNSGHKFLRFDAKSSTGKNWLLHLGSTGCTPTGTASTVPTSCAQANRVAVTLRDFDVDHDVVVADAGALFAGNGTTPDSSQVCMSSPKSPACAPMFAVLGLPFNGTAPAEQRFLHIARSALRASQR